MPYSRSAVVEQRAESRSIVVVGTFNPAIVSPGWLVAMGIVRDDQGRDASLGVNHPDVSQFTIGHIRYFIGRDRLQVLSEDSRGYPLVTDQTVAVLTNLPHTPVAKVGINLERHYQCPDEAAFHALGDNYAPKQQWAGILDVPRLEAMTMRSDRTNPLGFTKVTIQTSERVQPFGVRLFINDHYEVRGPDEPYSAKRAIAVITGRAEDSFAHSGEMMETIVK